MFNQEILSHAGAVQCEIQGAYLPLAVYAGVILKKVKLTVLNL